VTPARVTQIMNLLHLATPIQLIEFGQGEELNPTPFPAAVGPCHGGGLLSAIPISA
jgi:hypothetical protein